MTKYSKVPCEVCKGQGSLVHPYYHTTSSCYRCNGTGQHDDPREAEEAVKEQLGRIETKLDSVFELLKGVNPSSDKPTD